MPDGVNRLVNQKLMLTLESLTRGQRVLGILPHQPVTLISVTVNGDSVEIFYQRDDGTPGNALLFRADEARLALAQPGHYWDLAVDGDLVRLAAEAYRINLAHLFDPRLAVHTSLIRPLPHQITAVYGEMLPRQPLRFLLADDPGAGKTVMAGLLIKELMIRGDVQRCLVCAPGSLTEQWQDELWTKFRLPFEILTRDRIESSRSGNPFLDEDQLIIRLDQVARDEALQLLLKQSDWDLIICDEAHKMSASYFGDERRVTKRFQLGELLGGITRHFLLMTATPHNGKEEDFQLFLSLLDVDRFEGRYRPDVNEIDAADLMRRMVKEKLLQFDGRPLFPERRAYTRDFDLAPLELELYESVTAYVREEFNRADQIQNDGRKRGTIGFALTVLQRRLASSPEAIYQSLHRRRQRLEERLALARRDQLIANALADGDNATVVQLLEVG
ncbi:MAG: DEAD/DEAH box helicase [Caldilineaceae bacterium]